MEKKTLLIVDDDEMSRTVIRKFFGEIFTVIEAENGDEALNKIYSQPVNIVLLDIVMPKKNGFEVLQTVKCDVKYKDICILVATAIQEKTERKALELGADDIVFKPYDPIVIKKRIDNLLTMQDQKRELEGALYKAEAANRAKTDFLSRVTHDMRTPLNGILGITRLLKESCQDVHTQKDLDQLELSGHYLLNLINDTLDVNKIETGKLELHPGIYDGNNIINNMIGMIKPSMEEKCIHFDLRVDNLSNQSLYADMGRVLQIGMNILGNAVKFTPKNGHIWMTITGHKKDENTVVYTFVVEDDGIGMSKQYLPHIFENFSQENPGSTGNTTGSGLGMAITKQLLELMDGTIEVESELGKGTKFTLTIPFQIATKEQFAEFKNEQLRQYDEYKFDGKKILLFEDHPINAQITQRILEKKGLIVDVAKDGKEGLDLFVSSPDGHYDLILMDLRMPVMDGFETTIKIRSLDRLDAKKIPIIAMSANVFQEDRKKTKEVGMNDYLRKPIEVDVLFKTLVNSLNLTYRPLMKKILVVDDLDMNRDVIKEALSVNYDVVEASTGMEALEKLESDKSICLVITDIQMPEMNGVELIRRIRKNPSYDHISIIANTQFGDPEQEEEILNCGANDFVYKPTTPKIIEIRVENVLGRF